MEFALLSFSLALDQYFPTAAPLFHFRMVNVYSEPLYVENM